MPPMKKYILYIVFAIIFIALLIVIFDWSAFQEGYNDGLKDGLRNTK